MDKRISLNSIVLFKLENSKVKHGEVIELKNSHIKVRELISPDDIKGKIYLGGRNVYTGDRELYKTSKFLEISVKLVESTHPICTLNDYQTSKGFLLRQSYDQSTNFLHPDLPKVCLCKDNLNPDIGYFICSICNSIYHLSCVGNDSCPDCVPPLKRKAQDSTESLAKVTKSLPPAKELPLDLSKYKSLSDASKIELSNKIESVHNHYLSILSSLKQDDRTRQQIICKIKCALCLANEELKLSESTEVPLCQIEKLAVSIEAAIFFSTGQNSKNSEYSKKLRAIIFNLTQEKNHDFRGGILKGEIEAKDICQMQSRDMASSEIKKFRSERQKVYTKEQLIINENSKKLVVKSRKGDAVINMNEQLVSDEFNGNILESIHKKKDPEASLQESSFEFQRHDSTFEETVKEWAGVAVLQKIKEKLIQNLPSEQSSRLLNRIYSIQLRSSSL